MKRVRRMIVAVWGFALVLGVSAGISAQVGSQSSRLGWDQVGVTLAEVQAYTYRYYPDGGAAGTVAVATCTGTTSPFLCTIVFPAFTPGAHTVQLSAANSAGESVKSAAFSFVFVVVPGAPTNIRIQ